MKIFFILLIFAVLFISGCAAQQQTKTSPTVSPADAQIKPPTSLTPSPSPKVIENHFTIKEQNPPIALTSDIESKVGEIADCYFGKTQKTLTVTSGTRGSQSQAQAMFDKLEEGGDLEIYKNKVAKDEIVKAYEDGIIAGKRNSQIVADMAAVIDNQINSGVYISRHLISGAVDFSQNGMTTTDKIAFENCAKSNKDVTTVLDEADPVHFHIEIATPIKVVKLTVSMTGSGYGEVESSPKQCEDECEIASGTKITLTAKADDDSDFEQWGGDCSGTGNCVLIVDKDKAVTARFKLKEMPSPSISPTEILTPNPTPTETENVYSGSIDSANCAIERNQYGYVQKTTLSVSGKASGPVGAVLYSSLEPSCGSWSRGQGYSCIRKEGEPEQTSWTATGAWLHFETSYAISITGVDPNPSITFACQG